MTNKIDETPDIGSEKIVVPQHELLSDSGTREEPKLRIVTHDYDTDVFDGHELIARFAGEHHLSNAKRFVDSSPASLAAKDEELNKLRDIIKRSLQAAPVGNVTTHKPEYLPEIVRDLAFELGRLGGIEDKLAAMREAMEKARKAMASLVRWDDVMSDESCDISEEGEEEGLVAVCFQIRDALDALNQLDSTTPPAPNQEELAKLKAEIGHRDSSLSRWIEEREAGK